MPINWERLVICLVSGLTAVSGGYFLRIFLGSLDSMNGVGMIFIILGSMIVVMGTAISIV